jgi:phospholipid/cholesterol/gamma-HCH transport system substrate-binding protein
MRPGTTLGPGRTTPGLDLTAVFDGFQPLFSALAPGQVNELTGSLIAIFQGQGTTVDDLLQQTATITDNLAQREAIVDRVLDNLSQLLTTVAGSNQQLGQLVDGFTRLVGGLADSRGALGSAIDNVGALTTDLGTLLAQANPDLTPDVAKLATTAGSLAADQNAVDSFLTDLPAALEAPTKALSTGSYADLYLCNLTINVAPNNGVTAGPVDISVIPGVSTPGYPDPLYLPAHVSAGDPGVHTAACQ